MRFLRNLPIKLKLTVITMATSCAALLLACLSFAVIEQMQFRARLVRDLVTTALITGANSGAGLVFNEAGSVEQTLKSLSSDSHILSACIYDKNGNPFAKYQRAGLQGVFSPPRVRGDGSHFLDRQLEVFQKISLDGETIGMVYLNHDLEEMRASVRRYALVVAMLLAGCSLVSLVMVARLQRFISNPIVDLAKIAGAVAAKKDYSLRAVKTNEDEMGSLIDGFNEMLNQIQSRDSALHDAHDKLEDRVRERTRELQQEIAERKRSEEALRSSEEKFRQLAENVREVFWMTTPDMREVVYASPAYETVWGRSIGSLYANPTEWADAIVPEDRQRVFEVCRELASTRSSYDIEYRIKRPDGTIRWIRDRGVQVLDDCGRVCRVAGVASDVTEHKEAEAELEKVHKQLVETSRKAGMAEVATGVLHNVGNVLNSVNVSATLIAEQTRKSKVASLSRVAGLIRESNGCLGAFLTDDPKGRQLPAYLTQLADHLAREQASTLCELEQLRKNIEHIKDIVAMQQSYAKVSGISETVKVTDLVEDALRMNESALVHHKVRLFRDYDPHAPEITVEKHKVLQILVNLIRNAKYACDESGRDDKRLTIRVINGDVRVRIVVADNGVGIPVENLTRIFNHGFTTRTEGHGFGLHSGALAARELGGELRAHSDGPGLGATFTLELPAPSLQGATRQTL